MSSPAPGAVCPVFLGGPFHGEDVPADMVASGREYRAVPFLPVRDVGLFGPPAIGDVTYQAQKYRADLARGHWLEIMVWVDTRLCARGRTTLMLRLIYERGWHEQPNCD